MSWTDEQLAAMQKGAGNLLVAAGAGSGKTAVLIERVLGIITDESEPVDVDNLLIVTFTAAAAAEMRTRLAKALRERLQEEPQNSLLRRQLVLLQRARIMTIHSFCLEILKEHGYLLGLDAKSRIGSEGELAILRERVMDEVFEEAYADEESGLKLLLRQYCRGIGDESLRELVLRLLTFAESMPDVEGWLSGLSEVYVNNKPDDWLAYFAECLRADLSELAEQAAEVVRAAEYVPKYLPLLQAEAAALRDLADVAQDGDLAELVDGLSEIKFGRLPSITAKDEVDPEDKERVQNLRKRLKDGVGGLLQDSLPIINGSLADELRELAPSAEALVNLTLNFHRAWQAAKRRAHLWEFGDLEHYALDLLQNEALGVAAGLKQRFYEVLVDEYQDVNRVQETLLAALSRDDNRFMVGDIKQSIYRFRLAEPGLFMEKFAAYGEGQGGRRIDLNRNFRSQPWVLDGVNFIFAQLMRGGNTEIVYDEAAMLYAGRKDMPQYPCELLIIDKEAVRGQAGDEENPLAEMQTAELEGRLLAERILAEYESGRDWSEMVILLRAVKTAAPTICRELAAQGIPCVTDSQEDFVSLPEVQTVMNLLAVLDNPRQDIPLAAVLHSPLVGLNMADLADLRVGTGGGEQSLYEGLCQTHRPELLEFLLKLDDWRQKSREMGVAELLEYIYNRTALPELMESLPGGNLRRRNLNEIKQLAAEYDESGSLGIARFLRFLQAAGRRQKSAPKDSVPNAVRIMTIHKSKGLEFPVVFVAGLGGRLNEDDFRRDILLHRTLGLGMRRVDLAGRRKYLTFGYNVIMRKARWENIAEALRILYVAMTRAEEKLVLVGAADTKKLAVQINSRGRGNTVPTGFLAANRAFLPMVAAALAAHPDGKPLRDLAGMPFDVGADIAGAGGRWRVEIVHGLGGSATVGEQEVFSFADWLSGENDADNELKEAVAAGLRREYPAAALSALPVKWSATAMDKLQPLAVASEQEQAVEQIERSDDFSEEIAENAGKSGRTAEWYAAMGNLIHSLLEKADLAAIAEGGSAEAELAAKLARVAANYPSDVAAAVSAERLARFFTTSLGGRLLAAVRDNGTVLREQRFCAKLTVAELKELNLGAWRKLMAATGLAEEAAAEEALFFQGVIDLAFYDKSADGWVLVDYKTGGHRGMDDTAVVEKYGWQLGLYRHALAAATGENIASGWIYFTAGARAVRIF